MRMPSNLEGATGTEKVQASLEVIARGLCGPHRVIRLESSMIETECLFRISKPSPAEAAAEEMGSCWPLE